VLKVLSDSQVQPELPELLVLSAQPALEVQPVVSVHRDQPVTQVPQAPPVLKGRGV
jgi:hypothetical protein